MKHWDASDTLVSQEHYFYNGNGDVSRMEHLDGAGKLLEAYIYEYDSLGRLIRSQLEDDASLQLKTEHIYDASNRLSRQNYYIDGVDFTEEFVYNEKDGSLSQMTTANGDTLTYSYDSIKRLWKVNAANEDGKLYTKEYEYFHYDGTSEGALATNEITELSYSGIGKGAVFNYDYDYLGNITSYSHGNTKATYDYDDLGQLISVTDDGVTTTYTYDTAGNIRQVSQDGTVVDTYTYGNNNWKDLLTAFNNGKIAYEGQTFNTTTGAVTGTPTSGNPISYFNGTRWNFTWANGRQLMSASTTDSTGLVDTEISYTYDLNGLRTSKTVITNTYAIVRHTVTFVADGVTVKTMTVDDGYVLKDSDYPAVPKKAGYHGNWNKYTGSITGDITIQASYHVPYSCTVTFRADNVIVKVMTVQDGYVLNEMDYPSVPKKKNYTGVWDVYTGPITTDVTINAIYIPNDSQIPVPTLPPDLEIMSADDEEAASATEASASATSSPSLHLTDTVIEQHDYIYASGRLLREVITTTDAEGNVTTQTLEFTYDGNGYPYALTYTNGTASPITYYYITNLQGDVEYLMTSNGTVVAEYEYDAWGKVIMATGNLAQVNPLRYRGYCYDTDTDFYYLQSRFYDPEIRRFVNADGYASTGQGFLGQNMFAYCRNCPVAHLDTDGFEDEKATTKEYTGRGETYATPEEAVQAFAANYYYVTDAYEIEVYAYIVEVCVDGEIRYIYDHVTFGKPTYDRYGNKHYSVEPNFLYSETADGTYNGYRIVGDVHTHSVAEYFSVEDIYLNDQNLGHARKLGVEYTSYLVTPSCIRKYDGATGLCKYVADYIVTNTDWSFSYFCPKGSNIQCQYYCIM